MKNVKKNVKCTVRKGVIFSTKNPFLIHKVQKLCNVMEKLRSWDMSQNQIPFHYNFHYIFLYILFSCESGPWTLQLVCWCCPFLGNAHKPVREASPPWKSNRNESRVDACGFCMLVALLLLRREWRRKERRKGAYPLSTKWRRYATLVWSLPPAGQFWQFFLDCPLLANLGNFASSPFGGQFGQIGLECPLVVSLGSLAWEFLPGGQLGQLCQKHPRWPILSKWSVSAPDDRFVKLCLGMPPGGPPPACLLVADFGSIARVCPW